MLFADYMSSYESIDFTSRPIAQAVEDTEQTLLQALQGILPDCFASSSQGKQDHPDEPAQSSARDISPTDSDTIEISITLDAEAQEHMFLEKYVVLVCGIKPSLQTPLAGLHALMHAPDLFLYISVIALH